MTDITMKKRDQLAYLALYYAIHGDDERSEKIRLALRQLDNMQRVRKPEPVSV